MKTIVLILSALKDCWPLAFRKTLRRQAAWFMAQQEHREHEYKSAMSYERDRMKRRIAKTRAA